MNSEGVGELAWMITRKIAKEDAIANINAAHQIPAPRILIVARANSRYTPSTWLGGLESTGGYGSMDGDSFGPGKSCFQPGAGLSSKGAVNSMMSSSGSM
jgi:hypothetical protein